MADPKTAEEALESGDFEQAVELMESADSAESVEAEDTVEQTGSDTPAKAEGDGETPKPEAKDADSQPAEKADGILAKDGKHVLPFSVLESTRARLAQSEQLANQLQQEMQQRQAKQAELEAQMAELRQKVESAAARAGVVADETAQADDPNNPLAGLDESELPDHLVKAVKALNGLLQQTHQRLDTTTRELDALKQTAAAAAQRIAAADAELLQSAIDANPMLAAWQAEGGEAWAKAVEADQRLRADPKWASKPMSERFAKVVKVTCAELDIEPAATPKGAGKPKATEAAVASLSDLPGGSPSHQTGNDALASASGRQLMGMFAGMSDEQIERALRGLELE